MTPHALSDRYAVCAQVSTEDVQAIRDAGFNIVICNRPDNEDPGQPAAAEIEHACREVGLSFVHLPFQGAPPSTETQQALADLLTDPDAKIFAYCRSGQRCAMLYALVS